MMTRLWNKTEMHVNGGIKLSLYRSNRSKLVVAVGDVPGPLVSGCISFVTETDCDDGLPHTLEHLVFMGSKKYPFKGVLDVIANRCLADGTNAWTDQDHTAYTLNTVGSAGFFKVLPVYINHLLSPMLSDSQFATEVHHINGEGENAGVVYSEMQDHESEMETIMDRKMKECLYPANHPYAVDSGGRLKNLRDSCNINTVRAYHKTFYHLANMTVSVSGKVDHEQLLKIMEQVEEEHLSNVPTDFAAPFSFSLTAPKESMEKTVVCPSDDESRGIVDMTWFGHLPDDVYTGCALEVLFDYMSNTPVSPLQKDFILLADPLASSASFHINEQVVCVLQLQFSGVPTEKLNEIKNKFLDKTVADLIQPTAWNMERMSFLIEQSIQNELVKLETGVSHEIFGHVIGHQLFGRNQDKALVERVDQVALMRRLSCEPAAYWAELVQRFFTKPNVTIIGVPSEKMVDQISKEEKSRLKAQKEKLGSAGIKKCGENAAAFIKENTANKPSAELLDELIVKDLEDFDRFPVTVKTNFGDELNAAEKTFLGQFPFPTYLHSCHTKFVELFLLLDSEVLTAEQRSWLMLFNDLLFESPAIINGEKKTAEEVSVLYTKDLVDHSIEVGVSGQFDRFVDLRLKVSETKFANLAKWVEIFTRGIVFEVDRVKMCAQKLASEARDKKRDGSSVAGTALSTLTYLRNSNSHMYDEIVLEKVHEKVAVMCDKNPEDVIRKLEEIRTALFSAGVNVHVLCDVDRVDSKQFGTEMWKFASEGFGKTEAFTAKPGEFIDAASPGRQKVLTVGGSESSFLYQTALTDSDWHTEGIVPTMLFTQYLSQCEGPLWRGVRGDGLAYGANVYTKADRKTVTLSLYRCAQPSQAYEATKKIVMDIVESGKVDEAEFEAAKRSLVFELMQREATVSAAGKLSVLCVLRKTPPPFNKELCQRIWNTTWQDMVKIGGPRVANLFETKNFVRAIAVHPQKVSEMKKAFPGIESLSVASLQLDPATGCKRQVRRMMRNIPCIGDKNGDDSDHKKSKKSE